MESALNYPRMVMLISFLVLWLAAWAGGRLQQWRRLDEDLRSDFNVVQGATLTLLGLIIGFTFSMAISRYDQRKIYEEAEANAIGTEYARADLLPKTDATRVRNLLRQYIDLRIDFYEARDHAAQKNISRDTTTLQNQLWQAVVHSVSTQSTPITTLAVAGMNDVLNSQGYTQAAWWNRIPGSAWGLMFLIAIFANMLLGYGAKRLQPSLFVILPLIVSISFFLIADIDSSRQGIIRVHAQNIESLRDSLH